MALTNMGFKYRHMFSSDSDFVVKNLIKDNFPAEVFYDDIRGRNNRALEKNMDLYVAGFLVSHSLLQDTNKVLMMNVVKLCIMFFMTLNTTDPKPSSWKM